MGEKVAAMAPGAMNSVWTTKDQDATWERTQNSAWPKAKSEEKKLAKADGKWKSSVSRILEEKKMDTGLSVTSMRKPPPMSDHKRELIIKTERYYGSGEGLLNPNPVSNRFLKVKREAVAKKV